VCDLYFKYIINSDLFHDIPELNSKVLGCWCDPQKIFGSTKGFYCHGCVLVELFKIIKYHNYDTKKLQKDLQLLFN
jgi:hypothetical protein